VEKGIVMRLVGLCLGLLVALLPLSAAAQTDVDAQVIGVEGPERARLQAVVFRPPGNGPFPLLLVLHGSDGVHQGYLQWAPNFARAGYVTVVGCWFGTSQGQYPCQAVPGLMAPNLQATKNVVALIDAGRRVPGVRRDRVGLIGNSLGGGMVAIAASAGADVQGGVAISGAFESTISRNDASAIAVVANLRGPLLILHGTSDANVPVREARTYEDSARKLGKSVQAYYYDGGEHGLPWSPKFGEDVFRRSLEFLNQYVRR
jgi:dienelactone hydrolase